MMVSNKMGRVGLPLISGLVLILLLSLVALEFWNSDHDLKTVMSGMLKKQDVLSRMRVSLLKSVDLGRSAVMADTDELSSSLAEQSMVAAREVEQDKTILTQLVERDGTGKEKNLLKEFEGCWSEMRKLDDVLLKFAVENTNIKASKLSFSQGAAALERFQRSMSELTRNMTSSEQGDRVLRLACAALVAGLKIQYLCAPHIAASSDEDMNIIELKMKELESTVKDSLSELHAIIPVEKQAILKDASLAYDDFTTVVAEVVKLSRQNTNVKSLELSLGRNRKVAAQCDEILISLQDSIRSRTFEATR